ncbi:IclR family transcriptional regulator C-terminal domain-containing protein [Pigmentiphaga sp.]|uniref:IclR family transcriptional regulator domain-containing protein n=1 Tax=Pigmentiphaga sp. TaxID=1977564 RepID=UPI00128E5129|nr:IclR family transcriptional regulator C-terminal domain-containing protein [Pigmentiphaga sp.]MPS27708.1 IclR family transcriptional regulator [Alcaligenaceae bacterium SAGV5]MPS55134.1 IclR family transcriptional regulator [Alcaligenaceae bacterium SAGV3]MPT58301.1 IclR family transcriptional regulator [Alcaligenaceae bacterium]
MNSLPETRSKEDKEYVAGLEKGLAIIEAFGLRSGPLTLSEAAEITGHPRATARRSLLTLQRLGYVESDGRYFRLAPRTLRLGHAYVSSSPLPKLVQPVLETISERTKESSSLAVLDGGEVVFVARAATRRSLSDGLGMGSRLPAHCAATGRVLMAALPDEEAARLLARMPRRALTPRTRTGIPELTALLEEARRLGHATSDEELELGLRSIAVPIHDQAGRTVAAMSLVAATSRYTLERMVDVLLPELLGGRRMLSAML